MTLSPEFGGKSQEILAMTNEFKHLPVLQKKTPDDLFGPNFLIFSLVSCPLSLRLEQGLTGPMPGHCPRKVLSVSHRLIFYRLSLSMVKFCGSQIILKLFKLYPKLYFPKKEKPFRASGH